MRKQSVMLEKEQGNVETDTWLKHLAPVRLEGQEKLRSQLGCPEGLVPELPDEEPQWQCVNNKARTPREQGYKTRL